jgi:two-component system phosphate regulon sensor histidine kinase PhoR
MKLKRLVWHIYPNYIFLTLLVLVSLGWYMSAILKNVYIEQVSADLGARGELVMEQVRGQFDIDNRQVLTDLLIRLGEKSNTRITLIRKDGVVLADSHEDAERMENHGSRQEVIDAVSGLQGHTARFSRTLGQTLMYVALPFTENGKIIGSVRTAISISNIDETFNDVHRKLLLAGIVIVILAAPISWWLSRRISRPLEHMTKGAQRFSQGQLDIPLIEGGSLETSRLAQAMNSMGGELSQRIQSEVEQRSEMEAILGCMVEGIIAVDNHERVIRINSAVAKLFDINMNFEPGCSIYELIRHSGLLRFVKQSLRLQEPLEDELTLLGNENRYLHVQAAPLTGERNERIGVLIVLHDLTRLRKLESVRRDFVANVSHELKTPITAIRGAVETLLDEDGFDQTCQRFLKIIFKQSERLNSLVEDLLDLSRIEQASKQGGWELHDAPLRSLLEDARNGCEALLMQRQIEVVIHCNDDLHGKFNAPLLEQAVINLLSNAIKYSAEGGEVIITARELSEEILIEVQDFGPGIAEEHLPRLFERFYRIDQARSRELGGTGLGLAIVKHIVNAHHGRVSVESQVGQGSIFSIYLPQK